MTVSTIAAPTGVAHPRILERREAVEDENHRSQQRRVLGVALLVVALVAAYGLTQSPLLDLDEVRVIGANNTSPEAVRSISGLEPGEPLLGLDLSDAESRVRALPGVASVTATREWNGLVTFDVIERVPVARLNTAAGIVVAASDGTVLSLAEESDPTLPLITGAMLESSVGATLPIELGDALAVAAAMPSDIARVTDGVALSVDDIALRLVGGGSVSLGDARDLDEKFDAVRAILAQVNLYCVDRLDVQAPLVPVMTRNTDC